MQQESSTSNVTRPFTRQSPVNDLATTLPGRMFKAMIVRQLPPVATEKERRDLEDMTLGLPLETLVEFSEGKLTWGIADSLLDLANRKPHRLVGRGIGAAREALRKGTHAARR